MNDAYLQIEKMRKKAVRDSWIGYPLVILGVVYLLVLLSEMESSLPIFSRILLGLTPFLLGVIALLLRVYNKAEFIRLYKETYVRRAAEGLFENFQYEPEYGICEEDFIDFEFTKSGNTYKTEDLCSGFCKGIEFRMADVVSEANGKNTHLTFFHGQWIELGYEREAVMEIGSDIMLVPKDFRSDTPYGRKRFTRRHTRRHQVETLDVAFDDAFYCFANDDDDVDNILTDHMKKRLLYLKEQHDGQVIVSFINGRLYVLVNSVKDMLSLPITEQVNEEKAINKFRKDLEIVGRVIDELELGDTSETVEAEPEFEELYPEFQV